jgi:AraC-like DNA-binding protein
MSKECIIIESVKFFLSETLQSVQNNYLFVSPPMDKLSALLGRFSFNARVFFNGHFCDANQFDETAQVGQLHLVRAGPVVFTHAGADPIRIDEPAMVFYPRGLRHRLDVPPGATASLLCANVAFAAGSANPLARVLPDCIRMPLRDMGPLRHTLDLLFAEAGHAAQGRDVILDRLCDILVVQLLRDQLARRAADAGMLAGLADPQLAPVLDAMHARPQDAWQLQSLARLACMSRARFTEHFRNVVGMPPVEYLTRWRIGRACALLRDGMAVKAASAQVGYASAPAFTRVFTAHMGMSPRQWLRAHDAGQAA